MESNKIKIIPNGVQTVKIHTIEDDMEPRVAKDHRRAGGSAVARNLTAVAQSHAAQVRQHAVGHTGHGVAQLCNPRGGGELGF